MLMHMGEESGNQEIDPSEFERLTHLSESDLDEIEKGGEIGAASNLKNPHYWRALTAALIIARRDERETIPSKDFQLVTTPGNESQKLGVIVKGKPVYPAGIEEWGELVLAPTLEKDFNLSVIKLGRYQPPGYAPRKRS